MSLATEQADVSKSPFSSFKFLANLSFKFVVDAAAEDNFVYRVA